MILTRKQMVDSVMKALDDSVLHYPEEEREQAKARILGAWSGQMFDMPMRKGDDE
jgi:alpha-acetolactate decarboxylase